MRRVGWRDGSVQTGRGSQVLMFVTNAKSKQASPLDRQITAPENQASAEFDPIKPLEQGAW